jgi:hypothetical protein
VIHQDGRAWPLDGGLFFVLRNRQLHTVSHLRDGTSIVSDSFIKSPQSLRSVESRSTTSEQDFFMAKYAIGDVVKKNNGRSGVVRAIFKTLTGELCYAVEHEGALDFVEEAKLSPSTKTDLAA